LPFGGDYLWITSRGDFAFGTWTDRRLAHGAAISARTTVASTRTSMVI